MFTYTCEAAGGGFSMENVLWADLLGQSVWCKLPSEGTYAFFPKLSALLKSVLLEELESDL